MHISKRP